MQQRAKRKAKKRADAAAEGDLDISTSEEEEEDEKGNGDSGSDDDGNKQVEGDGDMGLGAWAAAGQIVSTNPMLSEDQALLDKQAEDKAARSSGWWLWGGSKVSGEDEGEVTAVQTIPEPEDVGIVLPETWASKEWLEGRDSW